MASRIRTVFALALCASASAMPQHFTRVSINSAPIVAAVAAAPTVALAPPVVPAPAFAVGRALEVAPAVEAAPAVEVAPAVALAPAAPAAAPIIPVLRRNEVHDEAGQYALGFETGNGIIVEEQGALKRNLDGEYKGDVVLVKRGSYSYPAPDGRTYRIEYTADENGFRPTGAHLPVGPVPVAVADV